MLYHTHTQVNFSPLIIQDGQAKTARQLQLTD